MRETAAGPSTAGGPEAGGLGLVFAGYVRAWRRACRRGRAATARVTRVRCSTVRSVVCERRRKVADRGLPRRVRSLASLLERVIVACAFWPGSADRGAVLPFGSSDALPRQGPSTEHWAVM